MSATNAYYYQFFKTENCFLIGESENKPSSAKKTLEQIKHLIDEQRKTNVTLSHIALGPKETIKTLKKIANEITENYRQKEERAHLNWFQKRFFSKKNQIEKINATIQATTEPIAPFARIPDAVFNQHVAPFLGAKSLVAVCGINRGGRIRGDQIILFRAQKWAGKYSIDNIEEAKKYLKSLYQELRLCCALPPSILIPTKCRAYDKEPIDLAAKLKDPPIMNWSHFLYSNGDLWYGKSHGQSLSQGKSRRLTLDVDLTLHRLSASNLQGVDYSTQLTREELFTILNTVFTQYSEWYPRPEKRLSFHLKNAFNAKLEDPSAPVPKALEEVSKSIFQHARKNGYLTITARLRALNADPHFSLTLDLTLPCV